MIKLIGIAIITALLLTGCNLFPGEDDYISKAGVQFISEEHDTGELPPNVLLEPNSVYELPDNTGNLITYNQRFLGWEDADNGTEYEIGDTITAAGLIELSPRWEEMEEPTSLSIPGDLVIALNTIFKDMFSDSDYTFEEEEFRDLIITYYNDVYVLALPEDLNDTLNWGDAKNEIEEIAVPGNGNGDAWKLDKDSWIFPSITILELMYEQLYLHGGKEFSADKNYWSSTEVDEDDTESLAHAFSFSTGSTLEREKSLPFYVRPYLTFTVTE